MATLAELLSGELTKDLEWREGELAVMRKQLISTRVGSIQERVMLRANVAMLYAHYEGFCKFALELYVDTLDKLKIRRGDLSWPLLTYSLDEFCASLRQEQERKVFFERILGELNDRLDDVAAYERPPQMANLWPDLLVSWLTRLGLGASTIAVEHALLESLVTNRNHIAHGKKVVISDRDQFERYAKAALIAMHEVAVGMVVSLETGSYKRASAGVTRINTAI